LKLKWTRRALHQLKEAQDYISRDNPDAANDVAKHIAEATRLLLTQLQLGRTGRVKGTREWVVNKTPYLLAYTVENNTLQILSVIHSKQDWPRSF
jgi:addiction module RelE/StbE family toxin